MQQQNDEVLQEITSFGYKVKQRLGQGQFGTVYLAVKDKDGVQYAIKTIEINLIKRSSKLMELFESEKNLLSTITSSHVIQMYEFYETDKYYYLVMDYCNGGDLASYFLKRKYFPEKEAIGYLIQLLNGFKDLHANFVIHRDIKLENILRHFPKGQTGNQIDDSVNVVLKIADLGLAKEMKEELITYTIVGTPVTKAPEIMCQKSYGYEVDMYSLGVILYQMVQGRYPFYESTEKKLLKLIKAQDIQFRDDIPLSDAMKDLIRQMLKYNRQERIKWCDILNHQALSFSQDLTKSKRLDDFQYEEIDQSRIGFQRNNDLYEISFYLPQYLIRRLMDQPHESKQVKNYLGFNAQDPSKMIVAKQVGIEYQENIDYKQKNEEVKYNYNIIQNMNYDCLMKVNEFIETKDKNYIVSEYLQNGNLYTNMKVQNKQLTQQDILTVLFSMLQALRVYHDYRMMHRNISLKSIFIGDVQLYTNKIINYKLGGFQNTYILKSSSQYTLANYIGFSPYVAPEILQNQIYSFSSDIYSLGVVLHQLIYRQLPFKGNDKQQLLDHIYSQNKQVKSQIKQNFDQSLLQLVNLMIKPNVADRITFQGIWNHNVFKKHFSFEFTTIQEMQNFYDDFCNQNSFLSQYIEKDTYHKFITSSLQFEQQPPDLPKAPKSGPIVQYKFNYKQNSRIFISPKANFPFDWITYENNSKKHTEIVSKQKSSISEFKSSYIQNQQEANEKEKMYYNKFVTKINQLIDSAKKSEDFELCLYYKNVLKEISEKKLEYDSVQDLSKKKELHNELHTNYEKAFKQ